MHVLLFADIASANVQSFVEGLQAEGFEVTVASFEDGDAIRLRSPLPASPLRYLFAAPRARQLVAATAPALVIGYFAAGYGTLARLSGGRPLVTVVAGSDVLRPRGAMARLVTRRNLRASDLVLAWSPELGEASIQMGARPEQLLVQPRGIDLSRFRTAEHRSQSSGLITTRALQEKYQHETLLNALGSFDQPWTLTMVGDGPHKKRLEALVEAKAIDARVTMTGRLEPDELARQLARHEVYVSTCPTDGVSASLLEAMASGLLPVVPDNPSNRDWVENGVNGLLHDGSVGGLSSALLRALRDADLRLRAQHHNARLTKMRADRSKNMAAIGEALRGLVGP